MLIVVEGLDASGKTTQTNLLVESYRKLGKKVYTLDFPRYSKNVFGKILKQFLQNQFGDSVNLNPELSALLFAGDRFESKELLDKWLSEKDSVVILNRYVPSNIAYNMAKSDNPEQIEKFIISLEYELLQLPKPDIVIVLGSSSAITKARLGNQTDAYESDNVFLDKVANVYLKLSEKYANWMLFPIEKDESKDSVHQRIFKQIKQYIIT
jgi:dTMP kinase